MSRPFPVVSVVGDRINSISDNTLYLSYLSYWAVVREVSIMVVSVVTIFVIRQK